MIDVAREGDIKAIAGAQWPQLFEQQRRDQ
jgi:hypothetical protein